jgi:hypothetical protein
MVRAMRSTRISLVVASGARLISTAMAIAPPARMAEFLRSPRNKT